MSAIPVALAVALVTALLLTPAVRAFAHRAAWVSRPRSDRWGRRTVALAGGVAIVAATAAGTLTVGRELDRFMLSLLAASGFMFFIGLLDDRLHLKPQTKFLAQILAAVGLVEVGFRFGLDLEGFVYFDQLLTILWLVGVTNAFNLLDNMDGLCAGIAAIAALALTALHALAGETATAAMCAALAGASLGFLRYNFHPATIFMGDSGSLFLGLFLGAAPLMRRLPGESSGVLSVLALPVLVLMIPLLDVTLVTIARRAAGRPVSVGGCDHASHRLVALGLSQRRAVLLLYALGLAGGLVALAVSQLDGYLASLLTPLFLLLVGGLGLHLGQVRIYDVERPGAGLSTPMRLPVLRHKAGRRLAEVAIDTVGLVVGLRLACWLRYESQVLEPHPQAVFSQAAPIIVVAHLVAYLVCGVYRGLWRHTSISDVPRLAGSVLAGLLLSVLGLRLFDRLADMSVAVLILNAIIQLGLLTGTRVSFRLLRDVLADGGDGERRRVLVVGGGDASELLLRRLKMDPSLAMEPVGVINEDAGAVGLEIHGTPVLGTSESIRDVLARSAAGEVVLVDEHYPSESWTRIQRVCAELGVPTRTLRTRHHRADAEGDQSAS